MIPPAALEPVTVTAVDLVVADVVIGNWTDDWPAGTVTTAGTDASVVLLKNMWTATPLEPAGPLR